VAAPTLPAAGGIITDPAYGARIMRITDANTGSSASCAYSNYPAFNCDNTRLFGYVTNSVPYSSSLPVKWVFDPDNFVLGSSSKLFPTEFPGGTSGHWETAIWSGVDPDILFTYAQITTKFYALNVATDEKTLIKDFASVLPANSFLWETSKSRDDDVFAFRVRQSGTWITTHSLAWRRSTDTVLVLEEVGIDGIDECEIDKSGDWLTIKTASNTKMVIINTDTLDRDTVLSGNPDYAPGHSGLGTGVLWGAEDNFNGISTRNLSTPHTWSYILEMGDDWSQGLHLSALADNESSITVSFFTSAEFTPSNPWNDTIVRVRTDGSKTVQYVCKHYSQSPLDYWDIPFGPTSLDGKYIAFNSNWGVSGGRYDLFVVKVPQPFYVLSAGGLYFPLTIGT
jgi:hypothetical protein